MNECTTKLVETERKLAGHENIDLPIKITEDKFTVDYRGDGITDEIFNFITKQIVEVLSKQKRVFAVCDSVIDKLNDQYKENWQCFISP